MGQGFVLDKIPKHRNKSQNGQNHYIKLKSFSSAKEINHRLGENICKVYYKLSILRIYKEFKHLDNNKTPNNPIQI
jgi:hypothetical protein